MGAEAVVVLARCAQVEAGTAPNFRVFTNTRRRVLRAAIRDRTEPVTPSPTPENGVGRGEAGDVALDEDAQLRELVEWINTEGGLHPQVASEVVLTRAGGLDVDRLADVFGVPAQTPRRRRLRAEQHRTRTLAR